MGDTSHFEVQAKAWRELAERAKRLAGGLSDGQARDSLLRYSEELQEKAAKLDVSPDARQGQDKR